MGDLKSCHLSGPVPVSVRCMSTSKDDGEPWGSTGSEETSRPRHAHCLLLLLTPSRGCVRWGAEDDSG